MRALTRRSFGAALAGLPLAAALPTAHGAASAAAPVPSLPTVAHRTVGAARVTLISDGWIDMPYAAFTGIAPADIEAGARAAGIGQRDGARIGFTVWLIDSPAGRVLVDAGPAGAVSPTTGRLPAALAALGVAPESVDAVLVTHLHVDHIAGLVADDRAVFPRAEVMAGAEDITHFTDPARAAAAPDILKSSFAQAERLAALYAGRLRPILRAGEEVLPGIASVDLRGHTPGHLGFRIGEGAESLTLVGDAILHPAIHPALPRVGLAFEPDKAAADAMRARFFAEAADWGGLIAATHMPFPGTGRIVAGEAGPVWAPADWDYAA